MTDEKQEEKEKQDRQTELDEALYRTCAKGAPEEVRELLAKGANPHAPHWGEPEICSDEDYYCIHEAAKNPDLRVLDALLEGGVDPGQTDYWGREALAYAARYNTLEMVQWLVKLGNDPERMDMDCDTVLSWSAANPDRRVVEYLMAKGAELDLSCDGHTELNVALLHGTPGRVRFFLERGSDVNRLWTGSFKEAPLENLRVLLEHGYDPDPTVSGAMYPQNTRLLDILDPERRALFEEFGAKKAKVKGNGMVKVRIYSFSYPRGLPEDRMGHGGGFVFDCRGLPNPFWVESLRKFSGKDEPVREFFAGHQKEMAAFAGAAEALVRQTVASFLSDGKRHLMVSFGCTGGQHRSVYMAEELARRLQGMPGVETELVHMAAWAWKKGAQE